MTDDAIEPAEVVECPLCHGIFPVIKTNTDDIVVVQPFPVEVVAPFRGLVHSSKPVAPPIACKRVIEGRMTVRRMPPVFVPHIFCCPGGDLVPPLFRALPSPQGDQDEGIAESENS